MFRRIDGWIGYGNFQERGDARESWSETFFVERIACANMVGNGGTWVAAICVQVSRLWWWRC